MNTILLTLQFSPYTSKSTEMVPNENDELKCKIFIFVLNYRNFAETMN